MYVYECCCSDTLHQPEALGQHFLDEAHLRVVLCWYLQHGGPLVPFPFKLPVAQVVRKPLSKSKMEPNTNIHYTARISVCTYTTHILIVFEYVLHQHTRTHSPLNINTYTHTHKHTPHTCTPSTYAYNLTHTHTHTLTYIHTHTLTHSHMY